MKAGFTKVTNMQGGLLQWRADGFPTTRGKIDLPAQLKDGIDFSEITFED